MSDATRASVALLDVAIAQNDPTLTSVAKQARSALFVAMIVRARNSIPPITMTTVGQPLADHDRAHADLEGRLKPWLDQSN